MIEAITAVQPYLKVYPSDEWVFAEPVARYARHLHPFVSIDLSIINPTWQGWIHLVSPIEPDDGMVGQNTQAFHNYYLRENWIAFHLNEEGRYELLGDFRYFYLENSPEDIPDQYPNQRQELEEHYAAQHASIVEAKSRFAKYGVLHSATQFAPLDRDFSNERPQRIIDQLGGSVGGAGNWADGFPFDSSDWNNFRPLTPDGTPFHFVANVTGYDYRVSAADEILLFFEPVSRIALLTFDW